MSDPVAMLYSTVKLMLMQLGDPRTRGLRETADAPDGAEVAVDTRIADEIIARANEAVSESEGLVARGNRDGARELLRRMAEELREYAPSSGRPDEVMSLARSMRSLADGL